MTLEVLFSQAVQGRTFLLLTLCGAALALGVQASGFLHRISRWLGLAADLLCACMLTAALGQILLASGSGLRLYGLLGLIIGVLIYSAGPGRLVGRLMNRAAARAGKCKRSRPSQKSDEKPLTAGK